MTDRMESILNTGLASYASFPHQTRGRLIAEESSPYRNHYQRDRDRIVHSMAFRRLEYKTQVFVNHEGDHYRTRLTHSLEVAQIARTISRALGLCEELAEAIALAHDLGHPPFGHAGEEALNSVMQPYGGFDHNAHALKIITQLEQRYASFDGLNLSWETIEGIAKHNGPLLPERNGFHLHADIRLCDAHYHLALDGYASLEAQVAALADDIAYHAHDIEDGLRAGLFSIDEVESLPIIGDIYRHNYMLYPHVDVQRIVYESTRSMINGLVSSLLSHTQSILRYHHIESVEQVRKMGIGLVGFPDEISKNHLVIKAFLMENMYRHYKVNRMSSKAGRVVRDLFIAYMDSPQCLPTMWQRKTCELDNPATVIADYIAGMTDRYAWKEHQQFYGTYAY
jgi:dGTPase